MGLDQHDIDELMRRHNKPHENPNLAKEEVVEILKLIGNTILFGLVFYPLLGVIFSLIGSGNLSEAIALTEHLSGIFMLITGFLFSIGFLVARGTFMAEMARRAWTNREAQDPESTMRDFRNFLDPSRLLIYMFFGSVLVYILAISLF